jgi:hypothetical protein
MSSWQDFYDKFMTPNMIIIIGILIIAGFRPSITELAIVGLLAFMNKEG